MAKALVFYDASCPLCVKEMTALKQHIGDKVRFINVLNTERMTHHPQINIERSQKELHVIDHQGQLRVAVDANVYLWELAEKKAYLKLLRLPLIRQLAALGYRLFARHRYTISRLLTGKSRCQSCEL
uniref:thiol-disulfide oxidoreductase DCC family protein n=1 Tax=Thaumasiovibrio occultus TaxID=1891184 RepID=UPI000B35A151|nr:DUF393 domain-containing protein [Thaumasiovibrio occultus]